MEGFDIRIWPSLTLSDQGSKELEVWKDEASKWIPQSKGLIIISKGLFG